MTDWRDVVTAVLFPAGAAFCLLGALGLVRFPDTASRLHAAAKAQTLGLLLLLVGAAAQTSPRHAPVLLLVAFFQLLTAPITSQVIGRAAYRTHGLERRRLVRDELADRLVRDGTPLPGDPRSQNAEAAEDGEEGEDAER